MFFDIYCELCKNKKISPSAAAIAMGINKGTVSVWKKRGTIPQTQQLQKIADYFDVSVDFLMNNEKKDTSAISGDVDDTELKFALFGAGEITDEQFEEVKQFARFIKERDARDNK